MWVRSYRRLSVVAVMGLLALAGSRADAASPFSRLSGTWSGSGHVRLDSGRSESIRCSANYVARSGGAGVGLGLRCASASNRIDLRASLTSVGNRVSGTWEERSYNASGNVSGVAAGSSLRLAINGSLSGQMVVTTNGGVQSISVRTDTGGLKGVNISLRRNH